MTKTFGERVVVRPDIKSFSLGTLHALLESAVLIETSKSGGHGLYTSAEITAEVMRRETATPNDDDFGDLPFDAAVKSFRRAGGQ